MIFDIDKHSGIALKNDDGAAMSYSELCSAVSDVSRAISLKGALCFSLCSNSIGSIIAYLSALEYGAPIVMLDKDKVDELLLPLIELYDPNYIWAPDDKIIEHGELVYSTHGYSLYRLSETKHHVNPQLSLLLTTSGSTGSPKLVRLSKKNILSNAQSISQYLAINSDERPVTSLPMHYSFGLSVINSHLIMGATVLLTEKSVLQREFWTYVKAEEATSLSGVPYTFEILRRIRFFNMDLPKLLTLTQAGGKLHQNLVKEYTENCNRTGKRFFVMYGQTEATARMSYLPPEFAISKCSSIGIPIPGGKFRIFDGDRNEITASDTDGELIYYGDNVSLGYAENVFDLAKGDDNHGVLHTGDIGKKDSEGFYYITGRLKRFVKVWGNRCNLDALEQLIKTKFDKIACTGVDDLISIFTTHASNADEIRQYASKLTGFNIKAFKVIFIPELPKTSSGKIAYSELQKMI